MTFIHVSLQSEAIGRNIPRSSIDIYKL